MYALELGSYGIIKLLTNTGFFSRMCVYDAIMPFWHRIYMYILGQEALGYSFYFQNKIVQNFLTYIRTLRGNAKKK